MSGDVGEQVSVTGSLAAATSRLGGTRAARSEAEWLLASVLQTSRSALFTASELTAAQAEQFADLLRQREEGVPLQYLLGSAPFRHLELRVGPGVFIPRPETELMLDIAGPHLESAGCIVDLCAGSGALAIAAATEYPGRRVIAVERAEQALVWLRDNVATLAPAVEVVAADIADPALLPGLRAHVVLANPPYVPETRRGQLAAEVGHDPDDAVFAAGDGLHVISSVIAVSARVLVTGGFLVIEHDDSHQREVLRLLANSKHWTAITGHRDLAGQPRFASAVRQDDIRSPNPLHERPPGHE